MRLILTCVLLCSVAARAAPRVALVTVSRGGRSAAEIARADVEALGLEVRSIDVAELPLEGRLQSLASEREQLRVELARAREHFIATRFAEGRQVVEAAERQAEWRADPEVAQLLAELATTAALCGDRDGFSRAVRHHSELKLDPARWSPDARAGFERARAELARVPRGRLTIAAPPSSLVFVDGVRAAEPTLELPQGRHFVLAFAPESAPGRETVELAESANVNVIHNPAEESEWRSLLRIRFTFGVPPSESELRRLAASLDAEAALAFDGDAPEWRERLRAGAKAVLEECAIHHAAPERSRAARPLSLKVGAGRCVARVHGSFRTARGGTLALDGAVSQGSATLEVPATLLPGSDRPYVLEYRLWGATARGARTSETAPLRVLVESEPIPRWYKKWWVWTLIGVGVASVVVIPAVVLTLPPPVTDVRLVGNGN